MTDEQINLAIAEMTGWEVPANVRTKTGRPGSPPDFGKNPSTGVWENKLPNFASDLNAIHEAEKKISDTEDNNQWSKFCEELNDICCRYHCGGRNNMCGFTIHATARQRCEAFLRTTGGWKE